MADLIDRAALIKDALKKGRKIRIDKYTGLWPCVLIADIKAVPAVDAEPVKHGQWIGEADGYADGGLVYDVWECSQCGYDADGADEKPHWNYCPNCGAKMDGGKDT